MANIQYIPPGNAEGAVLDRWQFDTFSSDMEAAIERMEDRLDRKDLAAERRESASALAAASAKLDAAEKEILRLRDELSKLESRSGHGERAAMFLVKNLLADKYQSFLKTTPLVIATMEDIRFSLLMAKACNVKIHRRVSGFASRNKHKPDAAIVRITSSAIECVGFTA